MKRHMKYWWIHCWLRLILVNGGLRYGWIFHRYADTKGYESDNGREIWRYRDWLIKALNEDKPYDQFLTEQIAGDLLPDPTDAQYIATAFSRNTMTNDEGGTDNEEFRTAAVMDRVSTTWESLMGTHFPACNVIAILMIHSVMMNIINSWLISIIPVMKMCPENILCLGSINDSLKAKAD